MRAVALRTYREARRASEIRAAQTRHSAEADLLRVLSTSLITVFAVVGANR